MNSNIAQWERYLRLLSGIFFLSYAFAGGPTWTFAALYPIVTGATGLCPAYALFNFSTK